MAVGGRVRVGKTVAVGLSVGVWDGNGDAVWVGEGDGSNNVRTVVTLGVTIVGFFFGAAPLQPDPARQMINRPKINESFILSGFPIL